MQLTRRQFTKALGTTMGCAAIPTKAWGYTPKALNLIASKSTNPIFIKEMPGALTNLWTFNQKVESKYGSIYSYGT